MKETWALLKKGKGICILLLCVLIYEAAGALIPFVQTQKVGTEFKENFDPQRFYGSGGDGPDRAAVVENSTDALNQRLEIIQQAKERIVLSTFDIRDGESSRDIFSALLEAADRGVTVQILVDGLYGSLHMNGNPMFYAAGSHPNIEIRFYNVPSLLKPWTINGRMHDKYLIADHKLLLLGGRNTFDYFLGTYDLDSLSYDRDVLIYHTGWENPASYPNSVISEMDAYFQKIWASKYCEVVFQTASGTMKQKASAASAELKKRYMELINSKPELANSDLDYESRTVPIHKASLIYNPTHIYAKEPWVWYQTQHLMEHAESRVYIQTPYAVLSQDMYAGIQKIAEAVPDPHMMVNATSVGDNFMASSDYTHNRKKILDTGIRLYEYFGSHSSHGKSILIDDNLSLIGSYNLDMRSTYVDTEIMLVIHGEEFNRQLEHCIMDLAEDALEVNADGTLVSDPDVQAQELSPAKKILFAVTSRLFQLFRYLI